VSNPFALLELEDTSTDIIEVEKMRPPKMLSMKIFLKTNLNTLILRKDIF
jgi:hypothetical protein